MSPLDELPESDTLWEALPDFEKISANGKFVYLGTNHSAAKINERPQMKVKFTYDFFMGKNEITCGEYNKIMKNFKQYKAYCPLDSTPIANVTYYDAVLFANAKSKLYKMDTAYEYRAATFSNEGHCTNLEGLIFLPDKKAFRLPTEAEWVYAAQMNWNPQSSWNIENSKNVLHNVCSSDKNAKLCDMAGNVMEWVFDWLGNNYDTTITNYVGASSANSLGERILKGGALEHRQKGCIFILAEMFIPLHHRHTQIMWVLGLRLAKFLSRFG